MRTRAHQRLVTIAQCPQLLGGKVGHLGVRRQRLCFRNRRFGITQLSERGHDAVKLRSFAADLLQAQVIRRNRGIGHQLLELVVAVLDIGERVQKCAHRMESSGVNISWQQ